MVSARIEFPPGIEVVEVEERVENEEVAADRRATPHGVVGKENDVPLAQRNVDDDGALRDIVAVEKSRREKIALIAETQRYARPQRRRNHLQRISHLLVRHRLRLP